MNITQEVTNGIKWLEIGGGKYDYTFDPDVGWVSINAEYVMHADRAAVGIRWHLSDEEISSIPSEDKEWVKA